MSLHEPQPQQSPTVVEGRDRLPLPQQQPLYQQHALQPYEPLPPPHPQMQHAPMPMMALSLHPNHHQLFPNPQSLQSLPLHYSPSPWPQPPQPQSVIINNIYIGDSTSALNFSGWAAQQMSNFAPVYAPSPSIADLAALVISEIKKTAAQAAPHPAPAPEPAPQPAPEPAPEPAPAPQPALAPEPAPEPEPQPAPEPVPAPQPASQPAPKNSSQTTTVVQIPRRLSPKPAASATSSQTTAANAPRFSSRLASKIAAAPTLVAPQRAKQPAAGEKRNRSGQYQKGPVRLALEKALSEAKRNPCLRTRTALLAAIDNCKRGRTPGRVERPIIAEARKLANEIESESSDDDDNDSSTDDDSDVSDSDGNGNESSDDNGSNGDGDADADGASDELSVVEEYDIAENDSRRAGFFETARRFAELRGDTRVSIKDMHCALLSFNAAKIPLPMVFRFKKGVYNSGAQLGNKKKAIANDDFSSLAYEVLMSANCRGVVGVLDGASCGSARTLNVHGVPASLIHMISDERYAPVVAEMRRVAAETGFNMPTDPISFRAFMQLLVGTENYQYFRAFFYDICGIWLGAEAKKGKCEARNPRQDIADLFDHGLVRLDPLNEKDKAIVGITISLHGGHGMKNVTKRQIKNDVKYVVARSAHRNGMHVEKHKYLHYNPMIYWSFVVSGATKEQLDKDWKEIVRMRSTRRPAVCVAEDKAAVGK